MGLGLLIGFNLIGGKLLAGKVGSAAGGGLTNSMEGAMKKIVEEVRGRAIFYTRGTRATNPRNRLGRVTGKLASSIAARVFKKGGTVIGEVFVQSLVYARVHEFGAEGPNAIVPRRAPFLVFTGRDGGLVFTKKVEIPPRPYLSPALDDKAQVIRDELGAAFEGSVS